jgi:hypothetical protein
MDNYKKQSLSISPETYIEIHQNLNLNTKPYLLKVFSYEGYTEHRLDQTEMLNLSEAIADFVFDNANTIEYTDELTGLARLWHHRRNEAIEELEKIKNE